MKIIALAGAIALAFTLAACTDRQKCFAAKIAYDQFVKSDRGGQAEKDAARRAFEDVRAKCAAADIEI